MKKTRLVKLKDEFYLLDSSDYLVKMAKEYPENTRVFCLDETHMEDPAECLRHSSKTCHCYGCLPLLGSSVQIDNLPLLDKCEEAIKTAFLFESHLENSEWEVTNKDVYKESMEQRISDYIMSKINQGDNFREGKGNLLAYHILINVTIDMILKLNTEDEIKLQIDRLVSDPKERKIG